MIRRTKGSFLIAALAVTLSVLIGIGSFSVSAAPTFQASTPTPASYTLGMLLQIKAGIPFAWLRSLPASNAPTIDTAGANEFVIIASPAPQFDGTQWWWAVRRGSGNVTGWIEQNSLQTAISPSATAPANATAIPNTPPASGGWAIGTALSVAPNVSFVWLRATASSAGLVRATAFRGAFLTVRDANPVWDGVQFWWLVNFPALNVYGYVEQQSLVVSVVPTATSVPVTVVPVTVLPTVVPQPTATSVPSGQAANWGIPSVVRVKATVPFVWIRVSPSSNGLTSGTVLSGGLLLVNGGPQFDGVQYWWLVQVSTKQSGWVEQNSLDLVVSLGSPAAASSGASSNSSSPAQPAATQSASG